jgi:predicted phosphodiesterase
MRFALYSDLHLEIKAWVPPVLDVDVVILAGDIGSHTHGLIWAAASFQQPVIFVAGNHEYYDAHLGMLAELQKLTWEQAGIYFLEKSSLRAFCSSHLRTSLLFGGDL